MDNILKSLLDTFKAKSPKTWLVVVMVLSVVAYTAQQGEVLGLFNVEGLPQQLLVGATWLLAILTGAHTVQKETPPQVDVQTDLQNQKLKELEDRITDLEGKSPNPKLTTQNSQLGTQNSKPPDLHANFL